MLHFLSTFIVVVLFFDVFIRCSSGEGGELPGVPRNSNDIHLKNAESDDSSVDAKLKVETQTLEKDVQSAVSKPDDVDLTKKNNKLGVNSHQSSSESISEQPGFSSVTATPEIESEAEDPQVIPAEEGEEETEIVSKEDKKEPLSTASTETYVENSQETSEINKETPQAEVIDSSLKETSGNLSPEFLENNNSLPTYGFESDSSEPSVSVTDDDDVGFPSENLKTSMTALEVEQDTDSEDDCSQSRETLKRVGSTSKFFVENSKLYNFRGARELCSKNNLVIAEVEGLADHRTLESFTSQSITGSRFYIGLNDIKTEGVFKHANGKNITFQNFLSSQPDDQNMNEDCVTMMKESKYSPAGAADFDCNKTAYVFCMFSANSQCYNDSLETRENWKILESHGLQIVMKATKRGYFISNFQATWKNAMKYCSNKSMSLFNMDNIVTMEFFKYILKREKEFISLPMPTVQYWTSGKFLKSHMNAPIIWHTKPDLTESEERGVEKHNATFSFSGLFKWSSKKARDPGGPHGWRRDLCVSFGFDNKPYETPFLRNTNCDLPNYFICYKEYPEEDPTVEVDPPQSPIKMENVEEPEKVDERTILELEAKFHNDTENTGIMECDTTDIKYTVPLQGRNGIIPHRYRWKPYFVAYIDPEFTKDERKLISNAMFQLSQHLTRCLNFFLFRRKDKPYGDYVHIKKGTTCSSDIGRKGGAQMMELASPRCMVTGTILHEMLHALGFFHEQCRLDRDEYVNILWRNIKKDHEGNFEKFDSTAFGVPYNQISIMHYSEYAFSRNRRRTIVARDGNAVGSQKVLQSTDILKLQKMYGCHG